MLKKTIMTVTLAALAIGSAPASYAADGRTIATERDHRTLQRLFKPHFRIQIPYISKGVRAATGDVSIAVFDRRTDGPNRCSYITYRGKRALACD